MPQQIDHFMAKMTSASGADEAALRDLVSKSWVPIPEEYLDLLRKFNGGKGWIGTSYVDLWAAEDIIQFNDEYGVREFHPGMLYFGSSMGGVAYAFKRQGDRAVIVEVPFDSIDPKDVVHRGDTLEDFFRFLVVQWSGSEGDRSPPQEN